MHAAHSYLFNAMLLGMLLGLCLSGLVWANDWNGFSISPSLCMLWHAVASITEYGLFQFSICYGIAIFCLGCSFYDIYSNSVAARQLKNELEFCAGYCIFVWTTIRNPAWVLLGAELLLTLLFPRFLTAHRIRSYIVCMFASCIFVWKRYDAMNTNFIMALSLTYSCSILWLTARAVSFKVD
ncbi:Hypothetical protein DHA2_150470 [Giardia duodenalis]|uniref:Uncharacterized protein n=1 Tax=Giardia intestinalis TaxID=5741 RepID=V6TK69_GIAIN|nr:Hypothetical protein DHA2_150470 [Giardia intestinalis]